MDIKNIPLGTPEEFNVLIEVPQGSQNKYEYNETLGAIVLDFVYSGDLTSPANYGSIVGTRGADGDMLDAFVFSSYPLSPGVIVVCKPIGIIEVLDRGEVNNKVLAVSVVDPLGKDLHNLDDLTEEQVRQLEDFLRDLAVQKNKIMEVKGFHGRELAIDEIKKAAIS